MPRIEVRVGAVVGVVVVVADDGHDHDSVHETLCHFVAEQGQLEVLVFLILSLSPYCYMDCYMDGWMDCDMDGWMDGWIGN